ncbi:MAG TPA: TraB domain-containing protein [Candidatus Micrarchaeota archaeon]|nr:TraB domain-containing protein [Candidatus Micrarchaeota archaeon]
MEIYLLPSVHILSSNPAHVRRAFEIARPDCIAVELCMSRFMSINSNKKPGLRQMLANPLLTALFFLQQSLGAVIGAKPGAEMMEGAKIAREAGMPLLLADVPIEATINNLSKSPLREKIALLLPQSAKTGVDLSQLESLANPDALTGALAAFEKSAPILYSALISSRDSHILRSVMASGGRRVLLIVGAGHAPGIIKLINSANSNSSRQITYKVLEYGALSGKQ